MQNLFRRKWAEENGHREVAKVGREVILNWPLLLRKFSGGEKSSAVSHPALFFNMRSPEFAAF